MGMGECDLCYGAISQGMAKAEVLYSRRRFLAGHNDHTERTGANLDQGGTSDDGREQLELHSQ
ncbi:hypothetical protein P691DRAFT_812047 [Macrolepiota fuliginosa MF-IS2]|uniref:Uncharacterized protein n=1 Tax=Macrolepiota fuliginosa MF-IS2 TaxID=1400762 RepID=A0A9P5XG71_9AGAR|nr:hypothetical protein P691DRAFT_812047 [Macrolepiota fuliginosa MF-IS2]